MILMLSSGFSPRVTQAVLPYIVGRRVALVPSALSSTKDREAALPGARAQMEPLGLTQGEVVEVERNLSPKRLYDYDAVYFLGGNAFLLLAHLRRRGYGPILARMAREGRPLMGTSGGALALGATTAHIALLDPSMNARTQLKDLDGLGLSQVSICPHKQRFMAKYPGFLARMAAFEQETGQKVYLLEDGEGVLDVEGQVQWIKEA